MLFQTHEGWSELRFVEPQAIQRGDTVPGEIGYFRNLCEMAIHEARAIEMQAFLLSLGDASWADRAGTAEKLRVWLESLGPSEERTMPIFRPVAPAVAKEIHASIRQVEGGNDAVQARVPGAAFKM